MCCVSTASGRKGHTRESDAHTQERKKASRVYGVNTASSRKGRTRERTHSATKKGRSATPIQEEESKKGGDTALSRKDALDSRTQSKQSGSFAYLYIAEKRREEGIAVVLSARGRDSLDARIHIHT